MDEFEKKNKESRTDIEIVSVFKALDAPRIVLLG